MHSTCFSQCVILAVLLEFSWIGTTIIIMNITMIIARYKSNNNKIESDKNNDSTNVDNNDR